MAEQREVAAAPPRHLIYFADPMCSWCWGFSTVIDHILHSFSGRLAVRLVMGGLRPGVSEPMSDDDKVRTRLHWEQVETASGQTFNFDFFQRKAFVNNTEPACRAVVAARRLVPEKAVFTLSLPPESDSSSPWTRLPSFRAIRSFRATGSASWATRSKEASDRNRNSEKMRILRFNRVSYRIKRGATRPATPGVSQL